MSTQASPTAADASAESTNRHWWNRLAERLAPSPTSIEAGELRSRFTNLETTAIVECPVAVPVRVGGTVRSLVLRCRAQVPALEVELYDGSDSLTVVFLGRRGIRGITPGRQLIVNGRVTRRGSDYVMYNPTYELLPAAA
ncbi:MAG TPA: OB-fold nucleic acid binding domain-containing protein [Actinomycetes bacterium]|nr:OB-fold nucleic acid binding domain-containing protein [Actinomycetes bacterium]